MSTIANPAIDTFTPAQRRVWDTTGPHVRPPSGAISVGSVGAAYEFEGVEAPPDHVLRTAIEQEITNAPPGATNAVQRPGTTACRGFGGNAQALTRQKR